MGTGIGIAGNVAIGIAVKGMIAVGLHRQQGSVLSEGVDIFNLR